MKVALGPHFYCAIVILHWTNNLDWGFVQVLKVKLTWCLLSFHIPVILLWLLFGKSLTLVLKDLIPMVYFGICNLVFRSVSDCQSCLLQMSVQVSHVIFFIVIICGHIPSLFLQSFFL